MKAEIYWIAGAPGVRLAVLPRPRGGDWLLDEVQSLRQVGVDVLVCLLTAEELAELGLTDEAACCVACGIQYIPFSIVDRSTPESHEETRNVVRMLAALLADGKAVAVHCRQGVGRSALVAACVLTALGARPAAAFDLIALARGCPVPDTEEQREYVEKFAERIASEGRSGG